MLNLNSILIGSENPKKLVSFYEKVLGKKPDMEDGEWAGFMVGSCFLSIGAHSKVHGKAKNPDRVIINFETTKVKEEFERIKRVSKATVVADPYAMDKEHWAATFADPDGNYFQLMSPWDMK